MRQKQPLKVFCGKGVLKNFAKFPEKLLCRRLLFKKYADLNLLKKRPDAGIVL